jgi:hypothetical protein
MTIFIIIREETGWSGGEHWTDNTVMPDGFTTKDAAETWVSEQPKKVNIDFDIKEINIKE